MRRQGVFEFGLNMQQHGVRWIFFYFFARVAVFQNSFVRGRIS